MKMTETLSHPPRNQPFNSRAESLVYLSTPEDLVTATVEDILTSILGRKATEAFYSHLLKKYDFGRDDVAAKPGLFCEAINEVFGKGGTVIQRIIIRNLLDNIKEEHSEICESSLAFAIAELKNHARLGNPFIL